MFLDKKFQGRELICFLVIMVLIIVCGCQIPVFAGEIKNEILSDELQQMIGSYSGKGQK